MPLMLLFMVQPNCRFTPAPNTDVFVLALRCYPELCDNTLFVTERGQHYRVIELRSIVETLGPEKTAALPAFHTLSGADNTGSFSGRGMLLCWKVIAADQSITTFLTHLGQAAQPDDEIAAAIEKFLSMFLSMYSRVVGNRGNIEICPRDLMAKESTIVGVKMFAASK
ncbi:hypothetical protein QZH41_013485, partial [Actinostola sp. cb2023]